MAHLDTAFEPARHHPLDTVERVISEQGWRFSRGRDDEISAELNGKWCDYSLHFAYSQEFGAVHFTCAFDARVPDHRRSPVHHLLALINDRLWLGHFTLWESEGLPMFRHTFLMRGTPGLARQQVKDLLEVALAESERFYPAFQFVVWAGKTPTEAMDAAIIDPVGEA